MSLETGAKKGWWGAHASMRHSREASMATLWAGTSQKTLSASPSCLERGGTVNREARNLRTPRTPNHNQAPQTKHRTHPPETAVAVCPATWKQLWQESPWYLGQQKSILKHLYHHRDQGFNSLLQTEADASCAACSEQLRQSGWQGNQHVCRCPDVQLKGRTRPTTQCLDELVGNAIMTHNSSRPDAKAVAQEVPLNASRWHNVPKPVCEKRMWKWRTILQKKQQARPITASWPPLHRQGVCLCQYGYPHPCKMGPFWRP